MRANQFILNSSNAMHESVAGPEKCWPGHRKVGTQPGTGKNAGKRVNDCEKIKEQGVAEGWPGELAGGTIGGIAGNLVGSAVGGPIGGVVGGAVGGAGGGIIGRELTKEEQLNEFAPILAAGARLVIAMAPKIAQVLKSTGKATTKAAAPVAKSGAEIAAKNAGQIGVGLGAYEIGSSVADIAKDITAKVGTALEEKTVMELAQVAFKFAIPAGIVLAILYGGKKVIDSLFSNSNSQQGVAEGGEKDRQWSNKDMERLRVATRDFDDIMASGGPDQAKHDLIKNRIQTKPMAGPKGQLPEQGVAEGSYDRDDYYNARRGSEYGRGLAATGYGGDGSGTRRDDIFKGQSKRLPADPFARTTGAVPTGSTGRIHSTAYPDEMDEGEKIGNMDADDFDAAMSRLKKLAGAGPMKTVYDPQKRVYKNMPTAQQPAQQPKK